MTPIDAQKFQKIKYENKTNSIDYMPTYEVNDTEHDDKTSAGESEKYIDQTGSV